MPGIRRLGIRGAVRKMTRTRRTDQLMQEHVVFYGVSSFWHRFRMTKTAVPADEYAADMETMSLVMDG